MAKWPWRSRSMPAIFKTDVRIPRWIFGANLVILAQIHQKLSCGQKKPWNSYNSESKWPKWPWRSRSMTSIFNTSWAYPRMRVWCKYGDFNPNLDELSHRQDEFPRILCQNGQNDLEGQGQWPPFSIPAESIPGFMFGATLVILAQIYDELSRWQIKFPKILNKNGQNDLEAQDLRPLFSIPTESIPWWMFGANLVIPGQIRDELSCRQGKVYGRTDRRRQRQYPFGLKGQGVKMVSGQLFIILMCMFQDI